MDGQRKTVEEFLRGLTLEEKSKLFNELLAVGEVYHSNRNTSFYTFRKIRRATKKYVECRKRTIEFRNQHNDELVIHQIHEQHVFKNHYRFQVFYNMQERNFSFIETMLDLLRQERMAHYAHQRMALA